MVAGIGSTYELISAVVTGGCQALCSGRCCETRPEEIPLTGVAAQPAAPAAERPSLGSRLWGRVTARWNGWSTGQRATISVASVAVGGGTILGSLRTIRDGINFAGSKFVDGVIIVGSPFASAIEATVHWVSGAANTVANGFVTAGEWVAVNPGTTVSIVAATAIVCACCCWPTKKETAAQTAGQPVAAAAGAAAQSAPAGTAGQRAAAAAGAAETPVHPRPLVGSGKREAAPEGQGNVVIDVTSLRSASQPSLQEQVAATRAIRLARQVEKRNASVAANEESN